MTPGNLEDELNDAFEKQQEEARRRAEASGHHNISPEEYQRNVQEVLTGLHSQWASSNLNQPPESKYKTAHDLVAATLPKTISAQDISAFCERGGLNATPSQDLGIFVSALVNHTDKTDAPLVLDLRRTPLLNYFGYRLERDVEVIGELGDDVGARMQKGKLTVRGNCSGVVGLHMGSIPQDTNYDMVQYLVNGWKLPQVKTTGPTITVEGYVGDVGAVRYSGIINYLSSKGNYRFGGIEDLKKWVKGEKHPLIEGMYDEVSQGKPVIFYAGIRNVLHPALLEIARDYNLGLYRRQMESWKAELPGQRDYQHRLEEWDQKNETQAIVLKGGSAIAAALAAIPFPGTIFISLPAYFKVRHDLNKGREKEREEFESKWHSANSRIKELTIQMANYEKLVSVTQNLFR